MTHLGRWLSALVDGELDDVERDRILNHLAGCAPCRVEANELRAIKRRMIALGQSASDDATADHLVDRARLSSSRSGRLAHLAPGLTGSGAAARGWWPRAGSPGLLLASGTAGALVVALGLTAFLLGGPRVAPAPRVTPAVDAYWLEHSYDMGQVPAVSPSRAPTGPAVLPTVSASATPTPAVSHPSPQRTPSSLRGAISRRS